MQLQPRSGSEQVVGHLILSVLRGEVARARGHGHGNTVGGEPDVQKLLL